VNNVLASTRTWIYSTMCCGLICVKGFEVSGGSIVRFVDILLVKLLTITIKLSFQLYFSA
jgi:hypothetical protein